MFIHWMPIDPMDKHRFILLLLDVHPPSSSGIDSVFIQCQEMATALLHGFPFTLQHHDMSLFLGNKCAHLVHHLPPGVLKHGWKIPDLWIIFTQALPDRKRIGRAPWSMFAHQC